MIRSIETSLAIVPSCLNAFLQTLNWEGEIVFLHLSQTAHTCLKMTDIISLKNEKHSHDERKSCANTNSPLPNTLPDNNHIFFVFSHTFLVVFLRLLCPTTQLHAITTFLWEWVYPAFRPFAQEFVINHWRVILLQTIALQKGLFFHFIRLNIYCFLPSPKMFESSKQIRIGTDLSAVGSCEQLQNLSQHLQWTLWWENLCDWKRTLIKSKYEF